MPDLPRSPYLPNGEDAPATQADTSLVFERILPRRAFEEVCHRVRVKLASGALKPGDKLPPERELAQQLGVSRHALREALRSLENAGVITLERGRAGGAFIRRGDPLSFVRSMRDMMTVGSLTLEELTEARMHLLDTVLLLACERAAASDLLALEANYSETSDAMIANQYERWLAAIIDFYRLLAAATKNRVIQVMVESVSSIVEDLMINMGYPQTLLLRSRRAVIEHIRNRDSAAAVAEMRNHLLSMRDYGKLRAATSNQAAKEPENAPFGPTSA